MVSITRTDGSSTGSDHKRSASRVPSLGSTRRSKLRMSSMVLSRGEMPPCTQNRLRTGGQRAVGRGNGGGGHVLCTTPCSTSPGWPCHVKWNTESKTKIGSEDIAEGLPLAPLPSVLLLNRCEGRGRGGGTITTCLTAGVHLEKNLVVVDTTRKKIRRL